MNSTDLKKKFHNFLITQGYKALTSSGKKSTVYDYQKRIDFVCEIEKCNWVQLSENIKNIIQEYGPNGFKSEFGAKSHNAVICALKQYQKFINQNHTINEASISNAFLKSELGKRQISYVEQRNSFYEINIQCNKYILKCITYNNNYTFISKSEIPNLTDNIMFTLVEWINNEPANIYLIPLSEWKNPDNTILKDKDYNGLNSSPEWGINVNQNNRHELAKYHIDKIIKSIKDNNNQKIIEDFENIEGNKETEKQALIKVRLGHSKLKELILKNKHECDICGLNHSKLLIASHIKPWAKSNNEEKLDSENILLLCPMHDALFDKGLISFDKNGKILISKEIDNNNKALVNINEDSCINITSEKQAEYLRWHRDNIFIK